MPGLRTLTKTPLFRRHTGGQRNASALPQNTNTSNTEGSERIRSWSVPGAEGTLRYGDSSLKEAEMIRDRLARADGEPGQCLRILPLTEDGKQACHRRSDADSRRR